MEKKNVIFLSVIAVATLLTAVVGTTFAYFTATVTGNSDAKTTNITTATLGVTFTDGSELSLNNLVPVSADENGGIVGTKTFTIKNDSAVPVVYKVYWKGVMNNFSSEEGSVVDLKYNLKATTDGEDGTCVTNDEVQVCTVDATVKTSQSFPRVNDAVLIENIVIPAGVTHTYSMDITFIDTGIDQSSQENKTFAGTLNVSAVQQAD